MHELRKIDISWFDNSYGEMREKMESNRTGFYDPKSSAGYSHNNRLECNASAKGSISTANPTVYAGDFVAPEQIIPPEGILDDMGNDLPWEACCTMNNS